MTDINKLIEGMREGGMSLKINDTALVLCYEVGLIAQAAFYAQVRDPELTAGYIAHLQTEASDAIMQLRVLLALVGLDFEETYKMGEAKLEERLDDFRTGRKPRPTDRLNRIIGQGFNPVGAKTGRLPYGPNSSSPPRPLPGSAGFMPNQPYPYHPRHDGD